jgi:molybdenum cofactor guanylyltransferase
MQTIHTKITGILLAGGMSRRMGLEKGQLRIGNALLYQYPLRILEQLCDEVLISTCKNELFPIKHRSICDEVKGIGPLGGIYSCLKQSANELNLVLSYDMPLVNENLFRLLISLAENFDVVLPAMQEQRPEPLCGLYRKSMTGVMEEIIAQHDYAVHRILPHCKSKIVRITEKMECWHPDLFLNINSVEDLNRLPYGFGAEEDEN